MKKNQRFYKEKNEPSTPGKWAVAIIILICVAIAIGDIIINSAK